MSDSRALRMPPSPPPLRGPPTLASMWSSPWPTSRYGDKPRDRGRIRADRIDVSSRHPVVPARGWLALSQRVWLRIVYRQAVGGADGTARSRAGQELPAPADVGLRHHSLDDNVPDGVDRVADQGEAVRQVNSLLAQSVNAMVMGCLFPLRSGPTRSLESRGGEGCVGGRTCREAHWVPEPRAWVGGLPFPLARHGGSWNRES